MITDTVDSDRLLYVSGVPSNTRQTLSDFLTSHDAGDDLEPKDWIMRITHGKFGNGFVSEIGNGTMKCLFGKQEKTLLYPLVLDSGLVEIVEDRR